MFLKDGCFISGEMCEFYFLFITPKKPCRIVTSINLTGNVMSFLRAGFISCFYVTQYTLRAQVMLNNQSGFENEIMLHSDMYFCMRVCVCMCVFEAGFLCVTLAVPELAM